MHPLAFVPAVLALCLVLAGCGLSNGGSSKSQSGSGSGGPGQGGIPDTYFGVIVHRTQDFPLQIPYGQFRGWDAGEAQWPNMETCQAASGSPSDSCFSWTHLDTELADLQQAHINDILYTLSRSPNWAVNLASDPSGQSGTDCDYYTAGAVDLPNMAGQCLLPTDLNADGSGSNQIWKNWVTAIATHVNQSSYLSTHAHIKYWEPWNEFHRSTVLINYAGEESFQGTYAQLVRLTEDVRCIITGKGTIHNYPAAGKSTPCTATPIDSTAVIVSPSGGATGNWLDAMQNFLYCNGSGSHAPLAGTQCTTGNAGSQAVDVINYHLYADVQTPEKVAENFIPNGKAILQAAEVSKPFISGEGSWGEITKPNDIWGDAYAEAGFIPKFYFLYWSGGVTMNYWYAADDSVEGTLIDPTTGQLSQPAAESWKLTYQWLVGATPTSNPFCSKSGTIYTCNFKQANGTPSQLVWDSQYGQNCTQSVEPILCGNTPYTVPTQFTKDWIDLAGNSHSISGTVTIGANPILLEGQ